MKPRLLLLLLVLGLCVCCAGTATAQTKRIDLSDVQKLVNLSDPQIAPDGKSIACIVSRVNWSDDRFDANLVLVDIAGGAQRTLTYDRKGIAAPRWSPTGDRPAFPAPPGPPSSPLAWSPDGKSILFTQQATPHFGDADQSVVMVLDVATGESRKLTAHKAFEGYATYSPDGSRISYWYPRDGDPNNVNEIHVTTAAGGDGADQTRAVDRNLVRAVWMPDGKSLLVGGHDGTRTALWLLPLGGVAKRLDLGEVSPSWGFWIDVSVGRDGAIAFAGSTPDRPTELYYLASATAPPRRLTDLNAEVASRQLGTMERLEWPGSDGFRDDGVVTYPPGFVKGKRYPLVLIIHGGPTAASVRGFNLFSQLVAAHDYIVFSPNYRGSDNLGNAYQRAIFNDAGDGPGRDVMAGIAEIVRLGVVDTTRIGVSGWSYGGYMTTWLIGHYHVWKAAVAGARSGERRVGAEGGRGVS